MIPLRFATTVLAESLGVPEVAARKALETLAAGGVSVCGQCETCGHYIPENGSPELGYCTARNVYGEDGDVESSEACSRWEPKREPVTVQKQSVRPPPFNVAAEVIA